MRHILSVISICALPTAAAPSCFDDAMLVLDGSWSMVEEGFGAFALPKIAEARNAIKVVTPEAEVNRNLGLVTYGPGGTTDCNGITLHFAPRPRARCRMAARLC